MSELLTPLPRPRTARPSRGGVPATGAHLLDWDWARYRLEDARNYWIATSSAARRPHTRPVWGVWLPAGFCFVTGSTAVRNLAVSREITVHLESGDEVVIAEGEATVLSAQADLSRLAEELHRKYRWALHLADGRLAGEGGQGGPAYLVRPRVVFGWAQNGESMTRWRFGPPGGR
ncbi:pyridoxamine 5'-phosphate oxidase family protein [Crossiella sp. SN42]|uniref:pyridoxamine 5'-phosphate oxidase family protein n=1 Tax=Crossiella sp. SN42 TaxID=2944808 RepID=UPI00207D2CF1|nr:pyridoxamine 5'-phosphate oxidase family protein [Crossiella sp. SN42]MCO1578707.1 pyridoxamine 5'-phosphate oxidase family protein [Crossiella sp. SN42]